MPFKMTANIYRGKHRGFVNFGPGALMLICWLNEILLLIINPMSFSSRSVLYPVRYFLHCRDPKANVCCYVILHFLGWNFRTQLLPQSDIFLMSSVVAVDLVYQKYLEDFNVINRKETVQLFCFVLFYQVGHLLIWQREIGSRTDPLGISGVTGSHEELFTIYSNWLPGCILLRRLWSKS